MKLDFDNPRGFAFFLFKLKGHWLYSPLYRRFADWIGLEGGEAVLDFGCGTGALSRHLAPRLQRGGQLTCMDASAAMLAVARKSLRRYGDVRFIVGSFEDLSPLKGEFDALTIHYMLHEIEKDERGKAVETFAAALKAGGGIFIREPTMAGHGMAPEEIRELMSSAGLEETTYVKGKLLGIKPFFAGVYRKAG